MVVVVSMGLGEGAGGRAYNGRAIHILFLRVVHDGRDARQPAPEGIL